MTDNDDVAAVLAAERRDRVPPAGVESRVVAALRESGHLRTRRAPGWLLTSLAAAAALALGVWIGTALQEAPVASTDAQTFLLLLYEDAGFNEGGAADAVQRVREYSDWTRSLAAAGHLNSGDELRSSGVELTAATSSTPISDASVRDEPQGFFVIKAADQAEAIEIARTCPHLAHGGRIVIRPIVGKR